MNRAVAFVQAVEASWTWLYTAGMPQESAVQRRAEITSAAWEYRAWTEELAVGKGEALLHAVWQFLAGMRYDVLWRFQDPSQLLSRKRLDEAGVAVVLLLGFVVGLPLAALALLAGPSIAENDDGMTATLVCVYGVAVIIVYGITSLLTLDRWPTASAALGVIGSICLVCCFAWWLPELAAVAGVAGVAAVAAGARAASSP